MTKLFFIFTNMKKIISFSFLLFSFFTLNAQSWQWAKRFGSSSNSTANDRFYDLVTDNVGNIYACGGYQAGTTFGSIALPDYGGAYDIFIAKYDCQGNLLWVNTAGSSSLDGANALDVDNNGNVYVSGFCTAQASGPLYFGDSTITANTSDFFLAKYDATGNFIWLQVAAPGVLNIGTNSSGVEILPNGNILVAGACNSPSGGAIFPGFNVTTGKFFAEFTSSGTIVNVFNYSSTVPLSVAKGTVKADALNNRYIAGYFTGDSIKIANQTLYRIGPQDGYIAKFNSANSLIWLYQLGYINEQFAISGFDVDSNGNTWITGSCNDTAHVGTFTLINSLSAVSGGMPFVAKFNTSGVPVYADNINVIAGCYAEAVAAFVDSAVFTGNFRGSALCGTTSLTATNIQDIFMATVKSGVGFVEAISIVVTVLASAMVILSGVMKLMKSEQVVTGLSNVGVGQYVTLLGIMEIGFMALFLFPKTRKIGLILLSCYFSGAIATELSHGGPVMNAAMPLALVWIAAILQDSNLFLTRTNTNVPV